MTEPTTAAGRALLYDPDEGYPAGLETEGFDCVWCGAPLVPDDGVWTDRAFGGGDYCSEGKAVGPTGTSPHLPVEREASSPALDVERLARAIAATSFSLPLNRSAIEAIAAEYVRLSTPEPSDD